MPGKYRPLGRHLEQKDEEGETQVELSFEKIEEIISDGLAPSARRLERWWGNSTANHVQAQDGWTGIGWKVQSVDLDEEQVVFVNDSEGIEIRERKPVERDLTSREGWSSAADDAMQNHLSVGLLKRELDLLPKALPLVSRNQEVVGDKTFAKMLDGGRIPYAVHATISESVWLLQQVDADRTFIVFGNDREVPETWIERFGHLATGVEFYFLDDDGELELMKEEGWVGLEGNPPGTTGLGRPDHGRSQ